MNKRLVYFEALKDHPWLGKIYARLTPGELEVARGFIVAWADKDKGSFELAVNRAFIDAGLNRPRRWREILELLSCSNSRL